MSSPHAEYLRRLDNCVERIKANERRHVRLGNAKLAVIVLGLLAAWLAFEHKLFSGYWLFAPVAAYIFLAVWHERVLRAQTAAERTAAFYHKGIARIEDRWIGEGQTGERFLDDKHLYANDLDLFGRGSMFELLSTARTPMGEEHLARWLLSPGEIATIAERQKSVAELRGELDLREHLAVIGQDLGARLNPGSFIQWAESEPSLHMPVMRVIAVALAVLAVATLLLAFVKLILWPFLIVLILEVPVMRRLESRANLVISTLSCNAEGLILFSRVLERFEDEQFTPPLLRKFASEQKREQEPASHSIRRLARMVNWIDGRESLFGHLIELPLLYTLNLGFATEAWRRRCGRKVRAWIETVGEIEALLSLGAYSFEHPLDPFPEFVEALPSQPLFRGEDLGHPLIPASDCVSNSVCLDKNVQVLLVSGSNMSGKSTFLRVVGINAVLAMAGAPIRGRSLQLTPVALGTRLRTTDSLQEGRSAFYTEILRIRQVFERDTRDRSLLFLFDELLEGTNSKDRRIGADGLIRALVNRGAIGIVTTHDLALTETTEALKGRVRNAHFEDHIEDGKMRFDYKLREGVVAKSNALELMRLIGLDV